MNDIVKLAVDLYKGNVEKYSTKESNEVLRQALIEANDGKAYIDYKSVRDGKCSKLFAIIEEILDNTVVEGLQGDEAFMALVDFRNTKLGDQNLFVIEDNTLFVVDDAAEGTQGVRRQRLGGAKESAIPTSLKIVRIYEELNRVLSGRVDFTKMIDKVAESFKKQLLDDINKAWEGITADQLGGTTYFPTAGAYDEDDLLDVIAHVEAAAGGKTATIVGTKKAVRNLKMSVLASDAKSDLYQTGYYGKFFGTPVVVTPQRHKVGSTDFVLDDNMLTIVAGDEKPIKVVKEGDSLVIMGNPLDNADLTQEYVYGERWGVGVVVADGNCGIGRYEIVND
jgi:hypothetical protein